MSNEYFNPASVPAPNAPGSSAVMRAEIARIAAAFDLMPVMAGSQNEFVVVDPTGTRLVASGFSFADLVSVSGAQTVTDKTFAWDDNTWVGFGTGATKNAGTGADEVLLLAEANKLPALDAWNQTNINPAAVANAVVAFGINLKADANNAVLTGAPVAPTPTTADNSARIATTAFVQEAVVAAGGATPSNANPVMDGVAAPGVANQVSRQDHVHPTDTSRAPASAGTAAGTSFAPDAGIVATNVQAAIVELVGDVDAKLAPKAPIDSPTFTGAPKAPTPLTASNDTSIATTAFTQALLAQQPAGMQPSNTAPLMNGVASAGVGVEGSRHDHVHPTDTSRAPASAATAAGTSFTPTGTLSATDVQGAIVELLGETATAAQGAKADTALQPAAIGATVQAFDADTAKTDVAQNFTAPQRSAVLTDNDGSFDLGAKQNFKCTTAGAVTLTFTNQADGLSGAVIFINASNHVVSAHANTKISAAALSRLSATGTYRIDYMSDGTNAFCTVSENLA